MTQQHLAHSVSGLAGASASAPCKRLHRCALEKMATNRIERQGKALHRKAKATFTSFDEAGNWCYGTAPRNEWKGTELQFSASQCKKEQVRERDSSAHHRQGNTQRLHRGRWLMLRHQGNAMNGIEPNHSESKGRECKRQSEHRSVMRRRATHTFT